MNKSNANEFYERIVEGTDYTETITLNDGRGGLEGVEIHPVDKGTLADVIQSLPDEMFDAVEDADNPDEAEEMLEESEGGASVASMSSETVDAFEDLLKESLRHPDLGSTQMDSVVEALDFGTLFELGGRVIDMSFSEGSAIKDFQEQQ